VKPTLAAAALVALMLAGCGTTTIDGDALEGEIQEDAEREGFVVDAVTCPSPDVEKNDVFECTVNVKGEERRLEVVQRNDDGNVGYELDSLRFGGTNGEEAAIALVIQAMNRNPAVLCEQVVAAYRAELRAQSGGCARGAAEVFPEPMDAYEVSFSGDTAAATAGDRTVAFERARDGAWLVARVE